MPSQKGPLQPSKAPSIPPLSFPCPCTCTSHGGAQWLLSVPSPYLVLSSQGSSTLAVLSSISLCLPGWLLQILLISHHPPLPLISKWAATELPLGLCGSATYFDTHAGKTPFHTTEKQLNLFSNVRQYSPWISAISNICWVFTRLQLSG